MVRQFMRSFAIGIILLQATLSWAQSADAKKYYFYLGGGTSLAAHGSDFHNKINDIRSRGGTRDPIGILDIAVYKQLDSKNFIGFAPGLIYEDYSADYTAVDGLAMHIYNLNAAYIHCLGESGLDQLSFRFTGGFSHIQQYEKNNSVETQHRYSGINLSSTLQYGFRASESTWALVNIGAYGVLANHVSMLGVALTVGFLL